MITVTYTEIVSAVAPNVVYLKRQYRLFGFLIYETVDTLR